KILSGIVKYFGVEDKFEQIVVVIDKLDKIGEQGVINELEAIGLGDIALKMLTLIYSKEFLETEEIKKPQSQLDQTIGMLNWLSRNVNNTEEGANELLLVFESLKKLGLKTA
ncbi:MAG: hypothetical protein KJZ55_10005, partial [Flavobacteriales bacterium]|nr:hypothetical protein [Flavobacteriales bacterium]